MRSEADNARAGRTGAERTATIAEAALVAAHMRAWLRDSVALAETLGVERREPWSPLPHQIPPPGDWDAWLLLAGRGAGKTDAAAAYTDAHMTGPPCLPGLPGGHRSAIVAPTHGDAVEACVNGPSGLRAHNPSVRLVTTQGGTFVRWPNGAEAKVFGAYTPEDVERLRAGGNRCFAWAEEFAAWRLLQACWDHLQFGLRLGAHPRVVLSTTPKPLPMLKRLVEFAQRWQAGDEPSTRVALTHATTDDNPNLDARVRARYQETYAGTRLGRQELGAEILDDVPGALWQYKMFEARATTTDRAGCVVAVDPSGSTSQGASEQGIVVAARGVDARGYVLADRSCSLSPDGWGRRAVQAYLDFDCDAIVAERNFGGDMVKFVVETAAAAMGVSGLTVRMVTASRGKAVRAQPIAALYEQGRVSHAEVFETLEDQLTSWTPESGTSPDRLDALVWALTDLMLGASTTAEFF